MSNSSNNTAMKADASMLVGAYGYAILGATVGMSNLLIGLSVLKFSALRQFNQYVFLMSLALADTANLFCWCAAGLYRLWIINSNQLDLQLTPMQCMLTPHMILGFTAYPFSVLMLVIISVDRLFMVSFSSFYILSLPSPTYAWAFVGTGLVFILSMGCIGFVGVYLSSPEAVPNALCMLPTLLQGAAPPYGPIFVYYIEHLSYIAIVSVVVFAAVPVAHKLRSDDSLPASQNKERQDKMTRTVAVSCLCTLILYIISDQVAYIAWHYELYLVAMSLWLMGMTNPLANAIIYQLRHHEMRVAFMALIKCKTMPENLAVWPKSNATRQSNVAVAPAKREG